MSSTAIAPRPGPSPVPPDPLRADHVPYIAVTEGEQGLCVTPDLVTGADGWVAYRNPAPYDRYPYSEVLLARTLGPVPSGRPDGNVLSPYRHAHCMLNRLCQGCAAPAARGPQGLLHVLRATRCDGSPAATTGYSDMPPSCARCALHRCPDLSLYGRKLLWVAQAEQVAVYASVFPPHTRLMVPERLVFLDDEETLSAAVATRFVCDLQQVSEADPADVAELARRQARSTRTVPVADSLSGMKPSAAPKGSA